MTVSELIETLGAYNPNSVVVCQEECGMWDNIQLVKADGASVAIVFGGGSPFSSEQ